MLIGSEGVADTETFNQIIKGGKMMDSPLRGFPVSEFEARLKRVQKLMAAEDLAGILLMTEPEVRYFSGFHTQF